MAEPSLQRKLAAHLSEMPVTVDGSLRTVTMGPGVALDVAGQVLAMVREHDEEHGRHPTGPRLADADLCASCGNQFKPGQVCDSCRVLAADPWADEHDSDSPGPNVIGMDHVCEHPIGDREVQLMVDILRGMAGLDPDARQRIRNWVDERFARTHPF